MLVLLHVPKKSRIIFLNYDKEFYVEYMFSVLILHLQIRVMALIAKKGARQGFEPWITCRL